MANAEPQPQIPKNYRVQRQASTNIRPTQVRQIQREERRKINTDWQYLKENELPNNASTDQIFNASYQKQGIQPQELNNKDLEGDAEYGKNYQSRENNARRSNSQDQNNRKEENTFETISRVGRSIKSNPSNNPRIVKKGLAKGRVSANTTAIFTWYGNLWLWVQLPIALVGLLSLGLFAGSESSTAGNIIGAADAITQSNATVRFFQGLTGQDLSIGENLKGASLTLFFISYISILVIGVISFMVMYLEYALGFSKSLSGSHSSFKTSSVLIALLGYATPGLNVLPWLFVWVGAVWLYPE